MFREVRINAHEVSNMTSGPVKLYRKEQDGMGNPV